MRKPSDLLMLALAVLLTAGGYMTFRVLLSGEMPDYASEIAAAVFGGLLTIVVTAIMLQKQSDVDMRKDRNSAMLGAKIELYGELLETLKGIVSADTVSEAETVHVQILNQKLAVLGGEKVVEAFRGFAERFAAGAKDAKLSDDEKADLLTASGVMAVQMRRDLLSREELPDFDEKRFSELVTANLKALPSPKTTPEGFLTYCDEEEKEYFGALLSFLAEQDMRTDMGTKGFSVWPNGTVSVLRCYPTEVTRRNQFRLGELPEDLRAELTTQLRDAGLPADRFAKAMVAFSPSELPVEDLCGMLLLIKQRTG